MTEKQERCQVCGRTTEELEQIQQKPELKTHQNITKCIKCINEYEFQANEGEQPVLQDNQKIKEIEQRIMEDEKEEGTKPETWKEKITATAKR